MKSRTTFEYTIRKMEAQGKLYFWTFTYREIHSLKTAMGLWNEFLTILKRKIGFRGVRVLELHEEHGVHFHVVTNKRFKIRAILAIAARYGFGRTNVKRITDVAGGIASVQIPVQAQGSLLRGWAKEANPDRGPSCEVAANSERRSFRSRE
jgi:hypothetical protein